MATNAPADVATAASPVAEVSPVETSTPARGAPAVPRAGSLHVSDLTPATTESTLYEFFCSLGENTISSIRVCRDSQTGHSLGYAYVNFHNEKDAQRALEELNYQNIDGRPCRISWSVRDPAVRKSGVANLFIKNLDKEFDHADLHDIFAKFGEIQSCKVSTDRVTGKSRGYGFVQFQKQEDAQNAMEQLKGKLINDKPITIGPYVPRNKRASPKQNLYLKQFNTKLTAEEFATLLAKATEDIGKITSPFLMTTTREDGTVESRGFGFANFESSEVAAMALERFKDQEKLKEIVPDLLSPVADLYVAYAMSKEQRRRQYSQGPSNRNLYIKHIAEEVTEEQLTQCFKQFGELASDAKLMFHPDTKAPRGFGFVCFKKPEDARTAITKMNNQILAGKPLYVSIAQPKAQRRHQLVQQFQSRTMPMAGAPAAFYPPGYPMRGPFPQGRAPPQYPRGMPRPGPPGRQGFPQGMPPRAAYPNPQGQGSLRDTLQRTPDDAKMQLLGDQLYNAILAAEKDDPLSRRVVGMLMGNTQSLPLDDAVNSMLGLLEDPTLLATAVEDAKRQAGPQ